MAGQAGQALTADAGAGQLTFRAMDPSNTNQWQWTLDLSAVSRVRIACILWTLHDYGPIASESGAVPSELAKLLRQRKGPYQARNNEPPVSNIVSRIIQLYPDLIVREKNVSRTFRMELAPGIGPNQLPPDPYAGAIDADRAVPPGVRPKRRPPTAKGGETVVVEATTVPAVATEMAPSDALAAVASFVESAMRMSGVTAHDVTPDERLDEALAECKRLQEMLDTQGEQLLLKMRENEVLRRALAKRNGQVPAAKL